VVADCGADDLATPGSAQAKSSHQPLDRAAGHGVSFTVHLLPNLVSTVNLQVRVPHSFDLWHQLAVAPGSVALQIRISTAGGIPAIG